MDSANLKTLYLSYNGFNRPAMFRGIPLIPFVLCLIALLLSFFIGVLTIGFYGLILPAIIIGVMMAIKQMCADDPNAMTLKFLQFKGLALKGFKSGNILKVE
ncbi:TPA: VirB3 family type IV secretion system protein [Salmonella enterica subsp. enterica serovar Paratyphi B]|uniref:Type IV secretion system protein VirB3 n=1 Tax=Salmonella diarizonae TaxID=59204 RepID=A0A5Y1YE59_SALDZ|nr:type IV secretion system protein VirB3 [Salmonella enterica]EBV3242493.1 type IV secretion system protein VirB3 [Salmonella enterica subsp. enterica serovar Oranienburg]ECC3916776.1 type IV secretion system protein VirB3 [Salmonella enterica subsp. diarizonae]EDR7001719.1 type IV secretion system protein VirB3 [Salmonella enterica subsp. enterica serovar Java]EHN1697430.1 VirB3 family type IV secretion system protein [Salmonella enterica subsp. enterica serovar Newport]